MARKKIISIILICAMMVVTLPALALGTNIIDCNFNNSSDMDQWSGKATLSWEENGDRNGTGALRATTVSSGKTVQVTPAITVKKGYTYQISCWLKSDAACQLGLETGWTQPTPSKIVVEKNGEFKNGLYFGISASSEWQHITYEVTVYDIKINDTEQTADSAPAAFYFLFKSDGSVFLLDDVVVTEVEEITEEKEHLSLENNADRYVEGSGAFSVNVAKYDKQGVKTEVTGAKLTSSNPSVFSVEDNRLVPKGTGYSLITAEYEGLTAGMTMVCIPADMPTQTEASIPEKFKAPSGSLAGHDGGQAYLQPTPAPSDWYALRVIVNRGSQWFAKGYRYMSGWFYDDLSSTTQAALYMDVEDSTTHHEDFVKDYSYGSFDWTGNNFYQVQVRAGVVNAGASSYELSGAAAKQTGTISRSKGWHQIAAMLVQDTTAAWGWSMVYYFDGQEFGRGDIVPKDSTTTESCFELRALNYGVEAYYDDLFLTGKVDSFDPQEQPELVEKTVYQHHFEGSLADWFANAKGAAALTESGGLSDSGAFRGLDCKEGFQFQYGKKLKVSNGKRYRVSAWVKSSSQVNALLGVEFSDQVKISPSLYKTIKSSDSWQQIVNEITVLDIKDKSGNPLSESETGVLFIRFQGDTDEAWLDSVEVIEYDYTKPPVVESVTVKGSPMAGAELKAETIVTDPDGDELAQSLYQWQSSTDGETWRDIDGAVSDTYVCTEQDIGSSLRVQVTPQSTRPPVTGETIFSAATPKIILPVTPPSVSEISVKGAPAAGNQLRAEYIYQKSEDGAAEGKTLFSWELSDREEGSYVPVSEQPEYTPTFTDCGKYIRVTVTPVDENGVIGESVTSPAVMIEDVDEYLFFVDQNGNDQNSGTIQSPFATLIRAKQAVRDLNKTDLTKPVTVYLREGTYCLEQGITFDEQDSGTEQSPVSYKAYPGEKVRITGAKMFDASCVQPVTDEAVLKRVLDPAAKEKLRQIDLGALGFSSIPEIEDYGFGLSSTYSPLEIYFDGVALSQSRWPNDDFTKITTAEVNGTDYKTNSFTLGYLDEENHTAKWDTAAIKDLYVSGFIGNDWAGVTQKLASVDTENKTVTSVGGTSYAPSANHKIYFFNLIEEIDMPGESYIDREKKIVYFYPYQQDLSNVEIAVADMNQPLFTLNGTKYVSFEGLYLDTTRNNAITAKSVSNVMIDGCEIGHTAANAITLNGTDCTIQNCHIYDLARGGLSISGGDRKALTSSNNVIRNNRMHKGERVYNAYVPMISASNCVGLTIENNKLYDSKHQLVQYDNSNDILFQYNEVFDAVNQAADMSAVYFGRNPSVLGIEFKYNYFHDIGNTYGGYGQQSIFWDDGSYGPLVYGNIFYRGTRTADQGGSIKNHCYPLKTFGGQFAQIKNNIIVDSPTAFRYSAWNDWYEWVYDKSSVRNSGIWSRMTAAGFDSDTWKEHYKDTSWQYLNQYFSTELKDQMTPLTGDELKQFIAEHKQPEVTNVFEGNVLAKVEETIQGGKVNETGTYKIPENQTESSFVDYGKDFKLTDSALSQIRKQIPDFENIPTEKIGLMPVSKNGQTFYPGGQQPSISNVKLTGDKTALQVNYHFSDPDGDKEGFSEISWWISSSKNGEYKQIPGEGDQELLLDDSYQGKYIKCRVTPIDVRMIDGESVETAAVLAGSEVIEPDKSALLSAIGQAEKLLEAAVVGKQPGNYTQASVDKFRLAVEEAKKIAEDKNADQNDLDNAVAQLTAAQNTFEKSKIKESPSPEVSPTSPIITPTSGPSSGGGTQISSGGFYGGSGINRPNQQPEQNVGFKDIAGHWAENDIIEMAQQGIVSGISSDTFAPDQDITRAEFAAILVRGLKISSVVSADTFRDVPSDSWYANAVISAASAGLIVGYDGYFRPDDLITREEMAVVITKAYSYLGKEAKRGKISMFSDAEEISPWAKDYVDHAAGAGLISGVTATTFAPKENTTRAQVTSLIKRLLD